MQRVLVGTVFLVATLGADALAQTLTQRPTEASKPAPISNPAQADQPTIPLTLPAGTPLKVALDKEVRVRKPGQPIQGKTLEPVYVFDKLVIPAGSAVKGKVSEIAGVSKKRWTMAAMNADFSPSREVQVEFDELVLPDGRHLPMKTAVFPGSAGVLQFVPANQKEKKGIARGKDMASRRISGARQEARRQWESAKQQIHEPGKLHRLERYGIARLPYHPQYMDAGTGFSADLKQPLDFGTEPLKPETLTSIGSQPPDGSIVHAVLVTPLSSAKNKKGDTVEAVITQPLVASEHLYLPQGSRLEGSVLQVRPARRLGRNGQLRIVFHQVLPPNGIEQKVEASLEGVAVSKGENLSLDSEGGAQVTTPKTRYLTTALSVALAATSAGPDDDRLRRGADRGGDVGGGAANGALGFGLLGTFAGAFAHSRVVASGFGFYGAGMSVYSHFLARGRDVVYPKDMSMVIGLGTREKQSAAPADLPVHASVQPIGPP
jgi:hypothetical protein